jgi:hypothetical protein
VGPRSAFEKSSSSLRRPPQPAAAASAPVAARAVAAALGVVCLLAGCAGMVAGDPVAAPPPRAASTQAVYDVVNAYNGERIGKATLSFSASGTRLDGINYQEPPVAAFGVTPAPVSTREFNAAGDLVRQVRSDGSAVTFDPPLRVLPFPLQPGARFRQTVTASSAGQASRQVSVYGRVAGWEMVRVGAGEFRALRVERDVYLGDQAFHRTETARREIDWFSPQLGLIVRSSEDSQFDDIAFGSGDEGGQPPPRRGDWMLRELLSVPGK